VGYHVYLRHGTLVCCQIENLLKSASVTAEMTTNVTHSYKLLNPFTYSFIKNSCKNKCIVLYTTIIKSNIQFKFQFKHYSFFVLDAGINEKRFLHHHDDCIVLGKDD